MTEYKIVLYYEKPMPEFFQNSMEAMLKRGVEQGFISGYEFQKKELGSDKILNPLILKDSKEIKKGYAESLRAELPTPVETFAELDEKESKVHETKREPVQDHTSGLDTRAEKRAEVIRGERKPGGLGSKHKEVRSDKPDNRKKGGK